MKIHYENKHYQVEEHPLAPKPYWVMDKTVINPIHAEECFYDVERAIDYADWLVEREERS